MTPLPSHDCHFHHTQSWTGHGSRVKCGRHPTAEALRACGADEAYRRLLRSGARPHFIAYYVLHMALQGRPWNDCKGAEKAALRGDFDALVAEHRGLNDHGIEKILDCIGTGLRR